MISSDVTVCAPPVQDIAIAEIIPHPEYSPTTYMNDIGLLRLAAPINISVGEQLCFVDDLSENCAFLFLMFHQSRIAVVPSKLHYAFF